MGGRTLETPGLGAGAARGDGRGFVGFQVSCFHGYQTVRYTPVPFRLPRLEPRVSRFCELRVSSPPPPPPPVLGTSPCTLKLDKEKLKHAGLVQENSFALWRVCTTGWGW
jgi:hypothetical protein